ncbi:hypothetical protein Q5752_005841 [Cryptotrichosporon argae]
MPKREESIFDLMYSHDSETFLLEHQLVALPRTWPPLPPPAQAQASRLDGARRPMDWDAAIAHAADDADVGIPLLVTGKNGRRVLSASAAGAAAAVGPSEGCDGERADHEVDDTDGDADGDRCCICLMGMRDRTIAGTCGHEYCFECIGVWANQARRCPLCSADMAAFLLHDLDALVPTKFYLPPLPQPRTLPSLSGPQDRALLAAALPDASEAELEGQLERRRVVYRHELFVKHIASNTHTRFSPNPTPRQISSSPMLQSRASLFLRRDLRVLAPVPDVEFLHAYVLSLLKSIDVRSEPAIQLLGRFLDTPGHPRGAEHLAHEVYSWLRSPYRELRKWDEVAQYDPIPEYAHARAPIRSISRSPSVVSRSPSPRRARDSHSPSAAPRAHSPGPSRARAHSRSPRSSGSPSPPRDPQRRDTFITSPSPGARPRRWDEPDTWLDPEYAAWLESDRQRAEERRLRWASQGHGRGRGRGRVARQSESVELLPAPHGLRAWSDESDAPRPDAAAHASNALEAGALAIRGVGARPVPDKRQSLLERLARAKDAAAGPGSSPLAAPPSALLAPAPVAASAAPPPAPEPVRARRLRLKLKLEHERATFSRRLGESRAQELRRRLLLLRRLRAADESDRRLARLSANERRRETRRRLMGELMRRAESEEDGVEEVVGGVLVEHPNRHAGAVDGDATDGVAGEEASAQDEERAEDEQQRHDERGERQAREQQLVRAEQQARRARHQAATTRAAELRAKLAREKAARARAAEPAASEAKAEAESGAAAEREEADKRARALRDKLAAAKKARELRTLLDARKRAARAQNEDAPAAGEEAAAVAMADGGAGTADGAGQGQVDDADDIDVEDFV